MRERMNVKWRTDRVQDNNSRASGKGIRMEGFIYCASDRASLNNNRGFLSPS